MSDITVKIEKSVPITIFEYPEIKERVDALFDAMESDIKSRFDEILDFILKRNDDFNKISYDNIHALFKIYFYKSILNEAVEITFAENGKFNMASNVFDLLSEERLKQAISGKPMIDAFKLAICKLPTKDALNACLHGSTMLLLEKEFLD